MQKIKNEKGFTFAEILIALSIMVIGFLATAQMQFLSLRQKQLAELGTIATNMIQFMADRDMAELKRIHLLNSIAYMEAQAGRLDPLSATEPHLQYCTGEKNVCTVCPCNVLEAITPNPSPQADGSGNPVPETTCAVVNVHDLDPSKIEYKYESPGCDAGGQDALYAVKQVLSQVDNTVTPTVITLTVTYAIKTPAQFNNTDFDSVSISDTLATQDFVITAHQENWAEIIGAGWNQVNVPHIP